ncbi:RhtB (resistance to homoserine/threonine) family protein [Povalibacter uvarum]|uniref:RhtB (Resistance to homoserine/threonine) family protein n=1 Tax=Povalibacter uvarum TaxID=732238 RepID=A0A841HHZ7_9GAMM|nr:LysE family transporter [Povalibacter uvarum]MBB6092617.1 RhtB (resistance to homoserine/threonine) family protein [Povalibacter uvarum]
MNFWQGFAVITVAHLLAAASPGPDFALVTRQSLVHGRRAGLLASIGIALGLSIHIVYSAAGLAAVIAHSVEWMTAIKMLGGGYLIYLGVRGLRATPAKCDDRSKPGGEPSSAQAPTLSGSAWRQIGGGFLCNAFNPKAPIYFLALFTIVLSPDLPLATLAIYGVWIMVLQWLWFSLVATVFAHNAIRGRLLAMSHWIDRVFGVAMIALGARVLMSVRDV